MTDSDTESPELSKKPIKKLNFDWYSGQPVVFFNLKIFKSSFMSPAGQNESNWLIIFDQMKVEDSCFNFIPIKIL